MSHPRQLNQFMLEQKLAALTKAADSNRTDVLEKGLQDGDLRVRVHAYRHLQDLGVVLPELTRGIPLQAGDRLFIVQQSL